MTQNFDWGLPSQVGPLGRFVFFRIGFKWGDHIQENCSEGFKGHPG